MLYYFQFHITTAKVCREGVRKKVKTAHEKERQQRGTRGQTGVEGSSSEAHLYWIFNKTKYETGACGMISVL